MKILSWDIGIKNLAYCLLSYENNNWKIHEWDIINISLDEKTEHPKCNVCNKKAKYVYLKENKHFHLCGSHKSVYTSCDITFDDFFEEKENKEKCENCKTNGKFKYNDKTYCKNHANIIFKKFIKESQLDIIPKDKSVMKIKIEELVVNMFKKLDELKKTWTVDMVLIENQPGLKNPTMKTLSSCLFSYFILNGIMNKTIKNVNFISPSNKLKLNENNTLEVLSKTSDGQKYKMTKSLGIKYCKQMIQHDKDNLKKLETYKKQDDLCDAFLQGAYFINKNIINKN